MKKIFTYQEQVRKLKQEIKILKQKEKLLACLKAEDTDIIVAHIKQCVQSPYHNKILAAGHDQLMSTIIQALNKLAEENNIRNRKNYEDTMLRIKLLAKYQKYYEEALYYKSGFRLRGFTPIKYASFFSVDIEGKEAWPVSCYLN